METEPTNNQTTPNPPGQPVIPLVSLSGSAPAGAVAAETSLLPVPLVAQNGSARPGVAQPSFVFSQTVPPDPLGSSGVTLELPAGQNVSEIGGDSNRPHMDPVVPGPVPPNPSFSDPMQTISASLRSSVSVVPAAQSISQSGINPGTNDPQQAQPGDPHLQAGAGQLRSSSTGRFASSTPAMLAVAPDASSSGVDLSIFAPEENADASISMSLALSSVLPLQLITSFASSTRTASTVTQTLTYLTSSTIQPLEDLDLDTDGIKHRPFNNTDEGLSGGTLSNMTNNLTSPSSSSGLAPGQSFSISTSSMNDVLLQTGSSSRSSSSNVNTYSSSSSSSLSVSSTRSVIVAVQSDNCSDAVPLAEPTPDPGSASGVNVEATTYIQSGTTLSGQAAISAMAADGAGGAVGVKTEEKGTLSSFAIVGIAGGILVFFIGAYIGWYQWRKKRRAKSLGNGDPDEKTRDDDDALTEASFGHDPFDDRATVYDAQTWYGEDDARYRRSRYTAYGDQYDHERYDAETSQPQVNENDHLAEYLDDQDEGAQRRGRRSEYGLSTYGGGLTAAVLDRTALPSTSYDDYFDRDFNGDVHDLNDVHAGSDDHNRATGRRIDASTPRQATTRKAQFTDPFRPPRPATRASPHSNQFDLSRSSARMSRTESYAYGSIYDGYTPGHHTAHGDAEEDAMPTPATSSLLPWSTPEKPQPPVPALPAITRRARSPSRLRNQRTAGYPAETHVDRSVGRDDRTIRAVVPRPPPAAVFAQTPVMQGGGWQGVIPPFR